MAWENAAEAASRAVRAGSNRDGAEAPRSSKADLDAPAGSA
jgi:hypothetical protein